MTGLLALTSLLLAITAIGARQRAVEARVCDCGAEFPEPHGVTCERRWVEHSEPAGVGA